MAWPWLVVSVAASAVARDLVAAALVSRTDGFLGGFFPVSATKFVELVLQAIDLLLEGINVA